MPKIRAKIMKSCLISSKLWHKCCRPLFLGHDVVSFCANFAVARFVVIGKLLALVVVWRHCPVCTCCMPAAAAAASRFILHHIQQAT